MGRVSRKGAARAAQDAQDAPLGKPSIAALPEDIILAILEQVEGLPGDSDQKQSRSDRRVPKNVLTIQNMRRASRQFNTLSSPFLVSTILVDCRKSSIERFQQVSRHPLISRGIRTVQVVLEPLTLQLVADFPEFLYCMKKTLLRTFMTVDRSSVKRLKAGDTPDNDGDSSSNNPTDRNLVLMRATITLMKLLENEDSVAKAKEVQSLSASLDLHLEDAVQLWERMRASWSSEMNEHSNKDRCTMQKRVQEDKYFPQQAIQCINKTHSSYEKLYREQQRLARLHEDGSNKFSHLIAEAMGKMGGNRPRAIRFMDEFPHRESLRRLVLARHSVGWEGFYESLAMDISRFACEDHDMLDYLDDGPLSKTVSLLPAALKAKELPLNIDLMTFDLTAAYIKTEDTCGALLSDALTFLRPKRVVFCDYWAPSEPLQGDYHNLLLATCLAQPSLTRVNFERPSCFEGGYDLLHVSCQTLSSAKLWRMEAACARVRIDASRSRSEDREGLIPIATNFRSRISRLTITGGMLRTRDVLSILRHLPAQLDEFHMADVLLINLDMDDITPDLENLLNHTDRLPNVNATRQDYFSRFLVAETLQWEEVLDVMRETKTFPLRPGPSSLVGKSPLRLRGLERGKTRLMAKFGLDLLAVLLAEIWGSDAFARAAMLRPIKAARIQEMVDHEEEEEDDHVWNEELDESPDEESDEDWDSEEGEEEDEDEDENSPETMNAAERYVLKLSDVNPVTEFRTKLALFSVREVVDKGILGELEVVMLVSKFARLDIDIAQEYNEMHID